MKRVTSKTYHGSTDEDPEDDFVSEVSESLEDADNIGWKHSATVYEVPDSPTAEEIEGVSEREQHRYEQWMDEEEQEQGQTTQPWRARLAIDAMVDLWTISDIVELSGVSKKTAERVTNQEEGRGNCEAIAEAQTGGRRKRVFVTYR